MIKNSFTIHHLKTKFNKHVIVHANKAIVKKTGLFFMFSMGAVFTFILLFLLIIIPTLPDINDVENLVAAQSSILYDRNGKILYTIHGDENREIIALSDISEHLIDAVLAIEDDQFYEHGGIDLPGIIKAVCSELRLCPQRGGSTITQQFIKNAFLSSERKYTRKAKEIILALKLEREYSKDEILEMYLNRISYGSSVYGVERASRAFFNKPAKDLTIAESAILGAIPKAPSYYFPYGEHRYATIDLDTEEVLRLDIRSEQDLINRNPSFITKGLLGKDYVFGEGEGTRTFYIRGRTDFVLERMLKLNLIDEHEYGLAIAEAKQIVFHEYRDNITAPHFVMYIREQLEAQYDKDQIEKGGLRIITTLDLDVQKMAEESIKQYAQKNEQNFKATNASLLALDPDNGQILAMVGSRDYWNEDIAGKVNVSLRPRLPGSSFKPIVYAAAFLQGFSPNTVLYDVQTKFGGWYEPENFDGQFRGPVNMRQSLAESLNIPAIKAGYLAGIPNVIDLARKMGIDLNQSDDWYGLSLALGAGEARLMDMVLAYSVFANGGYKLEPVSILKIEDRNGGILEEYETPKTRNLILDPQVAYMINHILSDVTARPAGHWRNRLSIPGQMNSAKTGTSNKKKNEVVFPFDTWTLGYTKHIAAGVWAGNSNGDHLAHAASGLDTAGGIWHDFMVAAHADKERLEFEKPEGVRWVRVAKRSGKLPTKHTPEDEVVSGLFASFSAPTQLDDSYQLVEIDKVSGKLATEFTPEPAREKKAFFKHHSILRDNANWENAVRAWAKENDQDEEPPTEYDDIHTATNTSIKPRIRIISPSANSTVSPPHIGVVVDIDSKDGVAQVDYYWDDELMESVTAAPFRGQLRISKRNTEEGSKHVLKAIAFDELYRSDQTAIDVKIGADSVAPVIRFIHPKEGSMLIPGSSMTAQVEAYDPNGALSKVDFYLNGELVETVRNLPYLWQFTVPNDDFSLKAIAHDFADNQSNVEVNVVVSESGSMLSGATRILSPGNNETLVAGKPALVELFLDKEGQEGLKELQLLAKESKKRPVTVASASGGEAGGATTYTFVWSTPPAGEYELYLKVVLQDDKVRFSKKVPVLVK